MIIAIIYEHDQYPSIASASSVELNSIKKKNADNGVKRSINAAFKTAKM